ncbi:MAG: 16S rRNA (cytosine1402-N4)-methyltransferase [Microgenomates group bacterium Gr01-1014_5]|nr:MAG: 16S rRNA (cytosine1402-N4)-methyltransferase [Microgenomates group bacterium Gr01-1014_5]
MIVKHLPVMLTEVVSLLGIKPGKKYIDSTVGGGGHTEAILKKGGEVLGIDQDPTSLAEARKRLLARFGEVAETRQACPDVFRLVRGNFANLQKIASEEDYCPVNGILFDLGFASFQMDNPERGLSLSKDGPLDMRLDPDLGVTAADILNVLPEGQLYKLIKEVGEADNAWSLTRAIVARRRLEPFTHTRDLASLIERLTGYRGKIHPATKVFMALRIVVNSEFENLQMALPQALDLVKSGGRIVVVSFHSGEDRIVKDTFREWENFGKVKILTNKPVVPSTLEILNNPRSRSAKLRAVVKI